MPVYHDKAKGRWRYTFNRIVRGSRIRASRLLPAGWGRSRAEKYERQETARLFALATGIEREEPLIDQAVALYLEHVIPIAKAGKKSAQHLASLLPWYEGKPLSELPDIARRFAQDQAGALTSGTIRNRLAYLKAACRYAWKHHGIGEADPAARMIIPAARNERQVYLRVAEFNRLHRAFDDREAAAVARLAFYTGLRWISELLPRKPSDVRKLRGQPWLYVGETKTGKIRMVPVHPAAAADLKRLPFTRHWRDYYAAFERARAKVGMKHVRMHDLRHSLASEILSSGGTLGDVQGALGHESVVSSRRYAHLYPERLARVMLRVGKR